MPSALCAPLPEWAEVSMLFIQTKRDMPAQEKKKAPHRCAHTHTEAWWAFKKYIQSMFKQVLLTLHQANAGVA